METKPIAVDKLVEDLDFYPRNEVSSTTVTGIADALAAGVMLPPIVIDAKSKRIIDGWHRARAYRRLKREVIEAEWREYRTEREMFLDAVRLNASHGRRLDPYDLRRCVARLRELGVEPDAIAEVIHVLPARLEDIGKQSALGPQGTVVPLKSGLMHLRERKLSRKQVEGIERASGMAALYHVNQLINLLENNLLPEHNAGLVDGLDKLMALWRQVRRQVV